MDNNLVARSQVESITESAVDDKRSCWNCKAPIDISVKFWKRYCSKACQTESAKKASRIGRKALKDEILAEESRSLHNIYSPTSPSENQNQIKKEGPNNA